MRLLPSNRASIDSNGTIGAVTERRENGSA
jgi:hypothetical protein